MSGVGIITESYKCDIITNEYKVPAHIHGSSTHVGQLGKMVIPDLRSILSDDEMNLITINVNATLEVLKVLDDELRSTLDKSCHLVPELQTPCMSAGISDSDQCAGDERGGDA
ncbi:hypothetical protein J6590_070664 [Homalodisca vitripennis]|nr:hypothetical protein J6590_070664 [Homalodisca vitripennis]